jgi:hypothetical protein
MTSRQAIPCPSQAVFPYSIGLRPLLPGERQQYLEDLNDAIEGLVKGATILERVVVRLVKDCRV